MKKIILLAAILFISVAVQAQTYLNSDRDNLSSLQPSMSFTVGAALSNTTNGANFNTGGLAGFNAGFAFELPVANALSITPEILYSQKGYTANTLYGNFTQRTQFIDVPVLAKIKATSRLHFYLGPQVSYLIASSNKFGTGFSEAAQYNYNNTGATLLFDGVIGAGINVTHSVELHARYAISLQGAYTASNAFPAYRSQALQIGFGFKLN